MDMKHSLDGSVNNMDSDQDLNENHIKYMTLQLRLFKLDCFRPTLLIQIQSKIGFNLKKQ